MEKDDALSRLHKSHAALLNTIAGLSPDELTHIQVEGVWTTKDLLGHIAAWDKTLLEPLSIFIHGGAFKALIIPDHDVWNHEQASQRFALSYSMIFDEMEAIRKELLGLTDKIPETQWQQTFQAPWGDQNNIIEMISGLAWHEEEHTKSILQRFQKKTHG
jgi:hypothetical protein